MRGMFTCGVLDVFMENGISFDGAAGISAGAAFGCNIKSRQAGRAIRYNKKYCTDPRYCSFRSLIKTGDLFGGEFCYRTIPQELDPFDYKTFAENPMEFYAGAVDVKTGKVVYHKFTDCGDTDMLWLQASASMPLVSRPVRVDGYERPVAYLTKEAAAALKAASDECVARGYRLKVYDAYRPQRAVSRFMRWAKDVGDTRMKAPFYPNLDKSVLFEQGYIAEKSGHSRGSTVDLTLFDMKTGKEVDMGGTFDWFGEESHPDYTGVTEEQLANRMLLREIMLAHGFKPLAEEWWHFTLKDEPYPDTYFDFPVR